MVVSKEISRRNFYRTKLRCFFLPFSSSLIFWSQSWSSSFLDERRHFDGSFNFRLKTYFILSSILRFIWEIRSAFAFSALVFTHDFWLCVCVYEENVQPGYAGYHFRHMCSTRRQTQTTNETERSRDWIAPFSKITFRYNNNEMSISQRNFMQFCWRFFPHSSVLSVASASSSDLMAVMQLLAEWTVQDQWCRPTGMSWHWTWQRFS